MDKPGTVNVIRAFCSVAHTCLNSHSVVLAAEVDCDYVRDTLVLCLHSISLSLDSLQLGSSYIIIHIPKPWICEFLLSLKWQVNAEMKLACVLR